MISLKEHLDHFEAGRHSMRENNRDLLRLGILLEGEFLEFIPALLDYIVNPNQDTAQEMTQEIADVGLYLEQILRMVGTNLYSEMFDKVTYNTTRFHSQTFSEKQYKEAYTSSKAETKAIGWKEEYYREPHVVYNHSVAQHTQQLYQKAA